MNPNSLRDHGKPHRPRNQPWLILALGFCWSLLFHQLVYAESERPVISLGNLLSTSQMVDYILYFPSQDNTLTPEQALKKPFGVLRDQPLSPLAHTHWFQLHFKNQKSVKQHKAITLGIAQPPYIRAYWVKGDEITPVSTNERIVQLSSYVYEVIPVELKPNEEKSLLLEYRGLANYPLQLKLMNEDRFIARRIQLNLLNGIGLGLGIGLLLFFFAHLLMRPSATLFFYNLFILSIVIFMAQIFGYGWRFWFPATAHLNAAATSVAGGFIYVFYFLFSAYLLKLNQYYPLLHRFLIGWSVIVALATFYGLYSPAYLVIGGLVAMGLPLTLFAAYQAYRRRQPSAGLFLAGCSLHALFSFGLLLACLGYDFGGNVFALATIGQFVDVFCFSAAILANSRHIEIMLTQQMQERQQDMDMLTRAEKTASELRDANNQSLLQAASSAHDLLQLMSSMRFQLALLDEHNPLGERLQLTLKSADDLLQTGLKRRQEHYQQTKASQDIRILLNSIALTFQPQCLAKPLVFKVNAQSAVLTCLPLVVQRILDNLLSNALRHTEKGKIVLTGRLRAQGYLIQVWDTGKGINEAHIQRLMMPFKQATNAQPSQQGYGLGLYIVAQLCQSAGYQFHITSKEGSGTCCHLFIPF